MDLAPTPPHGVDWSSYQVAHGVLTSCNAYVDSNRAESTNLRLVMPTT